jgi:hypothetical protein
VRPPELWTELLKQRDEGQQLVLHVLVQVAEFANEIIMQIDSPLHCFHYALQ